MMKPTANVVPKRVAIGGAWPDEDLDNLLDEIESIEMRLDHRCAAAIGMQPRMTSMAGARAAVMPFGSPAWAKDGPTSSPISQQRCFMNNRTKLMLSKAAQKKANAALFKAVRSNDVSGIENALSSGANPRAVSRGCTPLERAMKFFPQDWSPTAVGCLMESGGVVPTDLTEFRMEVFVDGLTRSGQAEALTLLMANAQEQEREYIIKTMRNLLCDARRDEDEAIEKVVAVAYTSARDVEMEAELSGVSWLHQIVCSGEATKVGCRLSGMSLKDTWGRVATFRRSNPVVLRHVLSLRTRLDGRWLGMTPLHMAAFIGDEAATEALLEAGADPDLPDHCGGVIGPEYGDITDAQLALIESYRLRNALRNALPRAASAVRARL